MCFSYYQTPIFWSSSHEELAQSRVQAGSFMENYNQIRNFLVKYLREQIAGIKINLMS